MIIVEKGNVQLNIKDDEMSHYLNLGYNVVDKNGKVLKKAIPSDIGTLKTAYVKNSERIEILKAENHKLETELEGTKAELEATKAEPQKTSKK